MTTNLERVATVAQEAKSPLDFQGRLVAMILDKMDSSNLALADSLSPDEMFRNVKAFHEKFGLPYDGAPRTLDPEMQIFRISTMHEELHEYEIAVRDGDLEGQFDALIDLCYFVLGTAHLQGFPFRKGWTRVHEANMRKVRATKDVPGKRNSKLDITKPKDWVPPTLTDLVHPKA